MARRIWKKKNYSNFFEERCNELGIFLPQQKIIKLFTGQNFKIYPTYILKFEL